MRAVTFFFASLFLVASAQGLFLLNPAEVQEDLGLTHDLTGADCTHELVHLESDGGVCGDAPDACQDFDLGRGPLVNGPDVTDALKDGIDVSDHLTIATSSDDIGDLITVEIDLDGLVPTIDLWRVGAAVYTTDCDGVDLTDPEAEYYVINGPQVPAVPGGTTEHEANLDLADPDECGDQWYVLWNQQPQYGAPGDALFEWSDGTWEIVPAQYKGGGATHYATTTNPDVTLASVRVEGPAEHPQHFMLVEGFCDAQEESFVLAFNEGLAVAFTPLTEGPFILHLFIQEDTLATQTALAEETAAFVTGGGLFEPQPASCNEDICTGIAAQLAMLVSASK